jgi:single-strand DNA-binding protein
MFTATITGNVGSVKLAQGNPRNENDPGFKVLNFTVASNSTTSKGSPVTNWTSCKLWGVRAEALAPHLSRGQQVLVIGRPEARAYDSQSGPKAEFVIHVEKLEFLGTKPRPQHDPA